MWSMWYVIKKVKHIQCIAVHAGSFKYALK